MFSKLSRYRSLEDVYAVDASGRRLVSKELRLLPVTTGTFRHSIEGADRLDHLAYKYYRRPTRWWRFCDANPEFLSPLELIGKSPTAAVRVPLGHDDESGAPPWPRLLRDLRAALGVDDVRVEENASELVTVQTTIGSETVSFQRPEITRAVLISYHRDSVTSEELTDVISAAGFEPGPLQTLDRLGKEIVMPPRTLGG